MAGAPMLSRLLEAGPTQFPAQLGFMVSPDSASSAPLSAATPVPVDSTASACTGLSTLSQSIQTTLRSITQSKLPQILNITCFVAIYFHFRPSVCWLFLLIPAKIWCNVIVCCVKCIHEIESQLNAFCNFLRRHNLNHCLQKNICLNSERYVVSLVVCVQSWM